MFVLLDLYGILARFTEVNTPARPEFVSLELVSLYPLSSYQDIYVISGSWNNR